MYNYFIQITQLENWFICKSIRDLCRKISAQDAYYQNVMHYSAYRAGVLKLGGAKDLQGGRE